jgi:hypothetical protein
MRTIRKNSKEAAALWASPLECRVYRESNSYAGVYVDAKYAREALEKGLHAKLTIDSDGVTYTVHVHDSQWYELRKLSLVPAVSRETADVNDGALDYLPAREHDRRAFGAELPGEDYSQPGVTDVSRETETAAERYAREAKARLAARVGEGLAEEFTSVAGSTDLDVVNVAELMAAAYAMGQAAPAVSRETPLPELRWAPYQEFGIPDPAAEVSEAPPGPVTVKAHGYRGNDVIIYWAEGEA